MSILVLDLETSTKLQYKRTANMFTGDNYIVAWGLGYDDNTPETYYMEEPPVGWLDGVEWLVGQNIKFDMLWLWDRKDVKDWLKAGGKVYDTMLAEYILTGQQSMYTSLDKLSMKYGGNLKNDEVKALWEAGVDTIDIPKDMLIDYLIHDILNTRIVFKAQCERCKELGMSATMLTHMEGNLFTIECEYNGMHIDSRKAETQRKGLEGDLVKIKAELEDYIPEDLPSHIIWNWGSKDHLSALIFGGKLAYKLQIHQKDPDTGELLYTKAIDKWPKVNKVAVDPNVVTDSDLYDRYKSGKKEGAIVYTNVPVQGKPKLKFETFYYDVCRKYEPLDEWKTKKDGVWKTDEDTLKFIENDIPVAKLVQTWRRIDKDLGTYYKRYDPDKDVEVGMLTLVMPETDIIHHTLNTTSTVTGRLSSSDPNLQNVSSGDKSRIKSCMDSRWGGEGRMGQVDFSQLEVVVKAFLSQDKDMISDVVNRVDFHVKRLAFKLGESYEDVFRKCKIEELSNYVLMRKQAKPISFQKSYGASAKGVAKSLGMDVATVKAFFDAEDKAYPGVVEYDSRVLSEVENSRVTTSKQEEVDGRLENLGVGFHVSPTGKRYVFHEVIAPPFMRNRSWGKQIIKNFMNTQTKNYPTQGFAGEIVYLVLGRIFREFLKRDNFDGLALLVNTVHDSIWTDSHESVSLEANRLVRECCEMAPQLYEERYGNECNVEFPADLEIGMDMLSLKTIPDDVTILKEFERQAA